MRDRLVAAGMEPAPSTPQELDAFMKRYLEQWAKTIRAANLKLE